MATIASNAGAAARDEGELIPADSPLAPYVSVNRERLHGEPCFKGTRVPIKVLFDHLRAGEAVDVFLADFPDVTRAQTTGVVDLASMGMLESLRRL